MCNIGMKCILVISKQLNDLNDKQGYWLHPEQNESYFSCMRADTEVFCVIFCFSKVLVLDHYKQVRNLELIPNARTLGYELSHTSISNSKQSQRYSSCAT